MAKSKKRPTNSPVRRPLTPTIMTEIGGLKRPPPSAGGCRPEGEWAAGYRIWTCYGHSSRGNRDVGALRIERRADGEDTALKVHQTLANSEGKLHTVRAEVRCRRDAFATPTSWTLRGGFSGSHMAGLPRLDHAEAGRLRDGTWERTAGGHTSSRKVPTPLTGDWCLFEAVTRMAFRRLAEPMTFHVLEGLSVLKADHRLLYRGPVPVTWGPAEVELHCFVQLGRGVYPYEYWLDDAHRLLLATTGPRAYILGPTAGKAAARGGRNT